MEGIKDREGGEARRGEGRRERMTLFIESTPGSVAQDRRGSSRDDVGRREKRRNFRDTQKARDRTR